MSTVIISGVSIGWVGIEIVLAPPHTLLPIGFGHQAPPWRAINYDYSLSLTLTAVAAQIAPNISLPPTGTTHAAVKFPASALEAIVGHYKAADDSVMTVTREKDHLNIQFSGETKADAVYPESATRYFSSNMNVDAKIEFLTDGHGGTISALRSDPPGKNSTPNAGSGKRDGG